MDNVYLLHFEDGSSGYLSHHGVKGMKWGQWNPETQAKYGQVNASGGGGGVSEEDEEDEKEKEDVKTKKPEKLNAEEFGYENTTAGRKAAYEEAGFNRKWSREKGMEVSEANFVKRLLPGKDNAKDLKTRLSSALKGLTWDAEMTNTLKTRRQKQQSRDYKNESAINRDEFKGDEKGLAKAQARTDAFYGKKGKNAQAQEARRRRKAKEKLLQMLNR